MYSVYVACARRYTLGRFAVINQRRRRGRIVVHKVSVPASLLLFLVSVSGGTDSHNFRTHNTRNRAPRRPASHHTAITRIVRARLTHFCGRFRTPSVA